MNAVARIVVRFPWLFIVGFLAVTVAAGLNLTNLVIDPEVKNQLPPDIPALVNSRTIEERFGGSEMVLVVLEAPDVLDPAVLDQLRDVATGLSQLEVVERVLSPFDIPRIEGEGGMLSTPDTIEDNPSSPEERAALAEAIRGNELVYGNVVARDFTAASAIAMLKADAIDSEVAAAVDAVIASVEGPATISVGGMPSVRDNVSNDIRSDLRRFVPIGLLLVLGFLYACFRRLRGVLLPFSVVVMSVVIAMGLIPAFGWKVQMVTVVLPVILLAVANDYGIHLMAKYQEDNTPDSKLDAQQLAIGVVDDLGTPVIAAGITTIAGLLCLTTHIIVPAAQLGILAAIGVGFALGCSLLFIPAVLAVLPVPAPSTHHSDDKGALDIGLHKVADFVSSQPKLIVGTVFLVTVVLSAGIHRLQVDTNPVNYYPADAPVAVTSDKVNRYFGGSTEVQVMVAGDIKEASVMKAIDTVHERMRDEKGVGYVTSIAQLVKTMNRSVHDSDEASYVIPDTRPEISQLFLLYSMGGDPEDLESLADFEFEHALITLRVDDLSTQEIGRVVRRTEEVLAEVAPDLETTMGGFGHVFTELVDAVVHGQIVSLALSLFLVFLLVAFAFRSPVAGVYAVLPLSMAMPILFGIMGWLNIELNIVTAMLSSIMIGVGVDYTIHFLWRYRQERRQGLEPDEAVMRTLVTSGRGIVFNALSVVVGFAVLLISSFLPVKFFGILVVVSITACLVGALALLPALCLLLRPKFLEP